MARIQLYWIQPDVQINLLRIMNLQIMSNSHHYKQEDHVERQPNYLDFLAVELELPKKTSRHCSRLAKLADIGQKGGLDIIPGGKEKLYNRGRMLTIP